MLALARDLGGLDVVGDRVAHVLLALEELADAHRRLDVGLIAVQHLLEREHRLIVLAVELVDAARFEERRDMLEVRLAQHVDEFRQAVLDAAFAHVGLSEHEDDVEVVRVERMPRLQSLARLRELFAADVGGAGLQIALDRALRIARLHQQFRRLDQEIGRTAGQPGDGLQADQRAGWIIAVELVARLIEKRRSAGSRLAGGRVARSRAWLCHDARLFLLL